MSDSDSSDNEGYEEEINEENNNEDDDDTNDNNSNIKYTTDGLSEQEYQSSTFQNENLEKSECCGKYFRKEGYEHFKKYNLIIQGVKTCIHCYISFCGYKFIDTSSKEKLSKSEIECLSFYLKNFVTDHDTSKCLRTSYGGKCLLCDASLGIYPSIVENELQQNEPNSTTIQTMISMGDIAVNDIIAIEPKHLELNLQGNNSKALFVDSKESTKTGSNSSILKPKDTSFIFIL